MLAALGHYNVNSLPECFTEWHVFVIVDSYRH